MERPLEDFTERIRFLNDSQNAVFLSLRASLDSISLDSSQRKGIHVTQVTLNRDYFIKLHKN